jgi:hypothetical protein
MLTKKKAIVCVSMCFSVLEQQQTETNNEQNDAALALNNSYTIIHRMPAHHTSGITEHNMGTQIEHMSQSIHTDWILNGLGKFSLQEGRSTSQ